MHEMSLAESVLGIIEDASAAQGFARVKRVVLEIGQLAAVEPEAMRFCFDAVMRDTLADGAKLEVIEVPGAGWCLDCARAVPMAERVDVCPHCGGVRLQPTGGLEMKVRELEVE